SEERMVFSTFSHGGYIKELSTNKITHITESDVKHKIYGCYIDQNELIWLNTLKGIVQIDSDNEIFFLNDESGLPINTIGCFYEDCLLTCTFLAFKQKKEIFIWGLLILV
ncbi:MAG: hypothetical protein ACKVJC_04800, partial [Flavobacteriales bacterium]